MSLTKTRNKVFSSNLAWHISCFGIITSDSFYIQCWSSGKLPSAVTHVTFKKRNWSLWMSCHTSCVGGSACLGRRRRDLSVGPLLYYHEVARRIFSVSPEMVKSPKLHHWAGLDVAAAGRTRLDLVFVFSPRRCGRRTRRAAQLKGDAVDLRDAPAAPLSSSGPWDRSEPPHYFRANSFVSTL